MMTASKQQPTPIMTAAGPGSEPDPIKKFRAKDLVFTPSNLVSTMRAFMVFPAIFAIMAQLNILAAAICFVAFLSDILDGWLARKFDTVSELGKVIDPLADKIFIGLVVITMAVYGLIPLWFLATILGRDMLILAGGIWAKRKLGVVLPSNYPGKAAALTTAATLFLVLAGVTGMTIVGLTYLSVVLMVVSFVVYGQRLAGLVAAAK
ncbi:MAG: CDP-alcohol phosphatidyltransferase family protein [Bacteroidota bacterium]|nr:CDP-alcohol phosphatidyltransferase family protein [Bacteroidota bacterium]MDP4231928.1 CDP-alcohol phosphatidyltransferase family protein [Bacteroidota bacterium]MDP4241365.1 CDP-alcohol phosphatidyltransferase family protein [Bacteroidota bacterium]MDP4287288.1 CDP-alcohol phosphatidyltransferase family protein [Bacteroidota bacterium]